MAACLPPRRWRLRLLSVSCAAFSLPGLAWAEQPRTVISAAWDSAYVSEGRDNIGEGGLISGAFDFSWGPVALSGWAAHGDSTTYREYNLGLGYSLVVNGVGVTLGYTRLEFGGIGEGPGDNELSLGIAVPAPGRAELTIGARYSTEADGTFLEAVLRRPCELGRSGAVLVPYVLFGFDAGYSTAAYDGPNHLEGGVSLECPVHDGVILSLYCAHCWGFGDVERDGGGDVTWGGARLALSF